MFRQALINLLLNAAKVTAENGSIRVLLEKRDGHVLLTVEDDGPGIPENKMKKLFTPYFSQSGKGTGLGLYSVMAVAEIHGGEISVNRSKLGGASFTLRFPDGLNGDGDNSTSSEGDTGPIPGNPLSQTLPAT